MRVSRPNSHVNPSRDSSIIARNNIAFATNSIAFASKYTTKNRGNKCRNVSIKMLKDVGMAVTKSRETRAVYMQQHRG